MWRGRPAHAPNHKSKPEKLPNPSPLPDGIPYKAPSMKLPPPRSPCQRTLQADMSYEGVPNGAPNLKPGITISTGDDDLR
jgi:hypothetical protein